MSILPLAAVALIVAVGVIAGHAAAAEETGPHDRHQDSRTAIPGDSLYQLPITLQTAEGKTLELADLRGHPLVVTMFYGHCSSVCPLLTAHVQQLVSQLSPAEQQRIRILMVSFDAVGDTPAALSRFKSRTPHSGRKLDRRPRCGE
jgi:protein SCO1/2